MNKRYYSISAGEITSDISNGDVIQLVDVVTNKESEFYHRGVAVAALGFALKDNPELSVDKLVSPCITPFYIYPNSSSY